MARSARLRLFAALLVRHLRLVDLLQGVVLPRVAARRLYFLLQPLRLSGGAAPRPVAREPQRSGERRLRRAFDTRHERRLPAHYERARQLHRQHGAAGDVRPLDGDGGDERNISSHGLLVSALRLRAAEAADVDEPFHARLQLVGALELDDARGHARALRRSR